MRATKKQARYHENATLAMGQSGSRRGSVGTPLSRVWVWVIE